MRGLSISNRDMAEAVITFDDTGRKAFEKSEKAKVKS